MTHGGADTRLECSVSTFLTSSLRLGFAPASSRYLTMSACRNSAAQITGDQPPSSCHTKKQSWGSWAKGGKPVTLFRRKHSKTKSVHLNVYVHSKSAHQILDNFGLSSLGCQVQTGHTVLSLHQKDLMVILNWPQGVLLWFGWPSCTFNIGSAPDLIKNWTMPMNPFSDAVINGVLRSVSNRFVTAPACKESGRWQRTNNTEAIGFAYSTWISKWAIARFPVDAAMWRAVWFLLSSHWRFGSAPSAEESGKCNTGFDEKHNLDLTYWTKLFRLPSNKSSRSNSFFLTATWRLFGAERYFLGLQSTHKPQIKQRKCRKWGQAAVHKLTFHWL